MEEEKRWHHLSMPIMYDRIKTYIEILKKKHKMLSSEKFKQEIYEILG